MLGFLMVIQEQSIMSICIIQNLAILLSLMRFSDLFTKHFII